MIKSLQPNKNLPPEITTKKYLRQPVAVTEKYRDKNPALFNNPCDLNDLGHPKGCGCGGSKVDKSSGM